MERKGDGDMGGRETEKRGNEGRNALGGLSTSGISKNGGGSVKGKKEGPSPKFNLAGRNCTRSVRAESERGRGTILYISVADT